MKNFFLHFTSVTLEIKQFKWVGHTIFNSIRRIRHVIKGSLCSETIRIRDITDKPPPLSAEAGTEAGAGDGMPAPSANPQQSAAQKRLQHTQAQVNEVVDIMKVNVEKVLERDSKLSELDDRADALQQGASQFEQQAGKLKNKFWWKNCKYPLSKEWQDVLQNENTLSFVSAEAGLETGAGEGMPGPQRNPQQAAAQKRLQHTQAQVNEVVDIMRVNVEKVLERDQKLSELDDRADALQQGASQFEQQAGKLKRKFWWKNCKMIAIMVGIGVVIVIIIVGNVDQHKFVGQDVFKSLLNTGTCFRSPHDKIIHDQP
uniref:V-SNARE coiled-coil homology domain-containing protein n=1 Tax=Strigamia maritima TaxID=126957 RepID=T1ISF5_STRMM